MQGFMQGMQYTQHKPFTQLTQDVANDIAGICNVI